MHSKLSEELSENRKILLNCTSWRKYRIFKGDFGIEIGEWNGYHSITQIYRPQKYCILKIGQYEDYNIYEEIVGMEPKRDRNQRLIVKK